MSSPVGQNDIRRHNSALVLETVAASPGISRAGIAERTGLTKTTVSMLVERLLSADVLAETGPQPRPSGRGRPATALSLSPTGPHGLGVEIGVDHLALCLVDLAGRVRTYRTLPGDHRGEDPARVLDRACGAARTELGRAAADGIPVSGVALAVPGLVEAATGVVRAAPNLGWRDVPLPDSLDGLPVSAANEADLAACAELWTGGHPGLRDFLYVSGEIGVGAGLVVDGALFPGSHGFAGEIGHVCVDPTDAGARCRCGARGCLETVAGREAVQRAAGAGAGELVPRLEADDARAVGAVRTSGRLLGTALASVVNAVGVPAVVLGGDYALLEPWLRPPLEDELAARVLTARWSPVPVLAGTLGREAPARGAAQSATRATLADPEAYVTGRRDRAATEA
ncbi:ROK family transcriptional regulator [Streptomyces albiaxialis]|uniref:ROK family transcriptional regulator n=1 Tax=Streptomyces albiaxialis TaxID=329523 RepID=A0ABP5HJ48_9ACTN